MREHEISDYIRARLTGSSRYIHSKTWLDEFAAIFPDVSREDLAKFLHIEATKAGITPL